jgi:hypothetical protein
VPYGPVVGVVYTLEQVVPLHESEPDCDAGMFCDVRPRHVAGFLIIRHFVVPKSSGATHNDVHENKNVGILPYSTAQSLFHLHLWFNAVPLALI